MKNVWANTEILLCRFHLTNSLWGKENQKLGLAYEYKNIDSITGQWLHCVPYSGYFPPDDMIPGKIAESVAGISMQDLQTQPP